MKKASKRSLKTIGIIGSTLIIVLVMLVTIFFSLKSKYEIIAKYAIYAHYRYAPINYKEELYFPSNYSIPKKSEKDKKRILGFLGVHEKSNLKLFKEVGTIQIYDNDYTHFWVVDDNEMSYSKASYLENKEITKKHLDENSNFVMCNDDEEKETRIDIDKESIIELEKEFGEIKYNIEDFENADKIYFIYVKADGGKKIHNRTFDERIIYIGSIFVKDNKFYYGNLNNEIKGKLYDTLIKKNL